MRLCVDACACVNVFLCIYALDGSGKEIRVYDDGEKVDTIAGVMMMMIMMIMMMMMMMICFFILQTLLNSVYLMRNSSEVCVCVCV